MFFYPYTEDIIKSYYKNSMTKWKKLNLYTDKHMDNFENSTISTFK